MNLLSGLQPVLEERDYIPVQAAVWHNAHTIHKIVAHPVYQCPVRLTEIRVCNPLKQTGPSLSVLLLAQVRSLCKIKNRLKLESDSIVVLLSNGCVKAPNLIRETREPVAREVALLFTYLYIWEVVIAPEKKAVLKLFGVRQKAFKDWDEMFSQVVFSPKRVNNTLSAILAPANPYGARTEPPLKSMEQGQVAAVLCYFEDWGLFAPSQWSFPLPLQNPRTSPG